MTTDDMINIASYLDGEMCYATYGVTYETGKQAYEALIFAANKIKALEKELMFACQFDGYVGVEKDKYDFAIEFMEEAGRDEPSFEDEVNGLRKLIQLAMEDKNE